MMLPSHDKRKRVKETLDTISALPKLASGKLTIFYSDSTGNYPKCAGLGAAAPAKLVPLPRGVNFGTF